MWVDTTSAHFGIVLHSIIYIPMFGHASCTRLPATHGFLAEFAIAVKPI